jgi:hypothetical protein
VAKEPAEPVAIRDVTFELHGRAVQQRGVGVPRLRTSTLRGLARVRVRELRSIDTDEADPLLAAIDTHDDRVPVDDTHDLRIIPAVRRLIARRGRVQEKRERHRERHQHGENEEDAEQPLRSQRTGRSAAQRPAPSIEAVIGDSSSSWR